MAGLLRDDLPEVELSEQRMQSVLVDIKRNSRNRRIAMVAPLALAAAVLAAMIAAPPRHGGLLVADADAEAADPQLPRVFGTNGVWQLAVPIDDDPFGDQGPASIIEAPVEPVSPSFTLSPPDQEELQSLPASTSTPPMSTSGQSPDDPVDPADLDWSQFEAVIRIEPVQAPDERAADPSSPVPQPVAEDAATSDSETADALASAVPESDDTEAPSADGAASSSDEDVTVAAMETSPQDELDAAEANPSTPVPASIDTQALPLSTPATILAQSVLVYSAHVSVTVQVVDDDSSVIDWCNTRVDWGDGSVTRVAGVDESALCTAACEYEAEPSTSGASSENDLGPTASSSIDSDPADSDPADSGLAIADESASEPGDGEPGDELAVAEDPDDASVAGLSGGILETVQFEHNYLEVIDASPRIFVATGDGCSYTLAELQLAPFTVVPLG